LTRDPGDAQPPRRGGRRITTNRRFRIAVIAGDRVGKEVMPEGLRALEKAAGRFGFALELEEHAFASRDWFARHGRMMPDERMERLQGVYAIYFGVVGWPAAVPDHVSLRASLLQFRRCFDQYVNLRPVRLMPGVHCPLAGREPGDIDFWLVRENTEGAYSAIGGRIFEGAERETVMQETVMTRHGVDRVLRFAFARAARRPRRRLTSAPSRTASRSPCPTGTSGWRLWRRPIRGSPGTSITSTSSARIAC
jgi:tartrate dehydrogenase/decarboxylase/D-malate dehydrogenase